MSPPAAAVISIRSTLALLDSRFENFAEGVADGKYAFWLGSGISLGRVPGLRGLVEKVIEYIRTRIDHGNANCRFKTSLDDVLNLAAATDLERAGIDLHQPVTTWPAGNALVTRLISNYSRLLAIRVPGDFDSLVWDAVDVRETYAASTIAPDVEHLCIAALSLEGAVSNIASANWDTLVEKAVDELTGGNPALAISVVARPVDLQLSRGAARLIKFHGCAGKAKDSPDDYRQWLVASADQVNGWCGKPENIPLVTALVGLLNANPTFMLGLSAQDSNIQHIFQTAAASLAWQLGTAPPSYVFSEDELGLDQQLLLRNVYRDQVSPANIDDVFEQARVQAYAKPLLTALVIEVMARKLRALIRMAPGLLSAAERQHLAQGITALRDALAASAAPSVDFVDALLSRFGRASKLLRVGQIDGTAKYQPISSQPVSGLQGNPDLPATGFPEAAVALGLIGSGVLQGHWTVAAESLSLDAGVLSIVSTTPGAVATKVFLTSSSENAARLRLRSHLVESQEPLLIQSKEAAVSMRRSPRAPAGRTLTPAAREISVAELLANASSFDELYNNFRSEISI